MNYIIRAVVDGNPIEFYASEENETYEEAFKVYQEFESENIFEHLIDNIQIIRASDGFVMYDTAHDWILKEYEVLSNSTWSELDHKYSKRIFDSHKSSVYFDVDGTLAYWHKDGKGLSYPEEILDPKNHYYRELEPHNFMIDLAKKLHDEGVDVCILSATDRNCFSDRWEWIDKYLPFIPKNNIILCPVGANKSHFCKCNSEQSILIDDYEKNLEDWKGLPIKSLNSVNSPSVKFNTIETVKAEEEMSSQEYDDYLNSCAEYIVDQIEIFQNLSKDIQIIDVYENPNNEEENIMLNLKISSSFREKIENEISCILPKKDFDLYVLIDRKGEAEVYAEFITGNGGDSVEVTSYLSESSKQKIEKEITDLLGNGYLKNGNLKNNLYVKGQ